MLLTDWMNALAEAGATPLANKRYETYCEGRSRGLSQADAWARTFRKDQKIPNNASNRATACKLEKERPELAARIAYLTQVRRAETGPDGIPEAFGHADLVALSLEISEALESALAAAQKSSISNTALTRLKQVLSAHLARQGKMADKGPISPSNAGQSAAWERFYSLEVCACG